MASEGVAVLQITGRDLLETSELAMQFQYGFWTARGDAATTVLNPAHQAIIETLRTAGYPMTPTQLATVLDVNLNTMKVHLMRLVERGLVAKDRQGRYTHRVITPEGTQGVTPVTQQLQAEEHRAPLTPTPDPVETVSEPTIPRQVMPDSRDDVHEIASEEVTVTRVTPDAPSETRPATNGYHNGSAPVALPPQFCPGCGAQTTWLDRETYYQCAQRPCGWKALKQAQGR